MKLSALLVALSAGIAVAQPAPPSEPPVVPAPGGLPGVQVGREPEPEAKPAVHAKYDGGTILYTDDDAFELKIQFRNQMRFEAIRPFDEGGPDQWLDQFYIPRSRLQAEGHVFGEDNRYKLEFSFGDRGSFAFIKDMFIEKRVPGTEQVYVRFGQWKRPFNRQEITSDFASTFNERSIENELAGGGRSQGIAVHNDYEDSPVPLEWAIGLFNTFNGGSDRPTWTTTCVEDPLTGDIECANTQPSTIRRDFGPTLVARVGYNTPKVKGYSESDLEGGPLRWAVGASYKIDFANFADGNFDTWGDNMSQAAEIDTIIKAYGFCLTAGAVITKVQDEDPQWGFYIQPSGFVTPAHFELGARFAFTTEEEPDDAGVLIDRNEIEARAAINYYFRGHSFKLANDIGIVMLTGDAPRPDNPDLQIRLMAQLVL